MARILAVGKYYPPFNGGTEAYTRDVCEELVKDHDVTAIVYSHAGASAVEAMNGVKVIRYRPQCVWNSQPIALQMCWDLDLAPYDLVHFHAPNFFANAVILSKLAFQNPNLPIVITHHMEVYGRRVLRALVMPLYRALASRAQAIIVTSQKNAILSRDLPRDAETTIIPLGISPDEYRLTDVERNRAMDWRRTIAGEARTIGFVGRHVRYKGLEILIEALTHLPDAHALIGGDGPTHNRIEQLSNEFGVRSRTHFLGQLSSAEKKRLLVASDAFAFPSTEVTEAFGVSQLEAMALGVPVVSSDLPTGVTDVAIHGKTALLSPPGNARALASNLEDVLTNRTLASRLANEARRHVSQYFTKRAVLSRTCEVIERALGHQRPTSVSAPQSRPANDVALGSVSP